MKVAEELRKRGYEVEEDGADLAVEKDGKRIAVEVETGKSDVEANIKRDLERGFDEVIVASTRKLSRKPVHPEKVMCVTVSEVLSSVGDSSLP